MKLKIVLIIIFSLLLIPVYSSLAQEPYSSSGSVSVIGAIKIDLFSTINLNPVTVEIYQPSVITIRILSPTGQGIPDRRVEIVAPELIITQPLNRTDSTGSTSGSGYSQIPGTYVVCAKDTTFGYDIEIINCRTLYVIPVTAPVFLTEPYYTKGFTNTLAWQSIGTGYQYYIEASESPTFETVLTNSGWINNTSYQFTNLENEKMYFYRVKGRNPYGGVSAWSSVVFSVQDSQPPEIETLSIGDIGDNTTTEWDLNFLVQMIFRVTDNLQLNKGDFLCVNSLGITYSCVNDYKMEGDNLIVNVRLRDLERIAGAYLSERYEFCIEASDAGGNITRTCGIYLNIPKEESKPIRPNIIDRIEKSLDDTVGQIELEDLERITTTTSFVTIVTATILSIGSILNLPYILIQLFLNFISWLGLKAGSKPLGYVYDSLTKEPISQAIVRIFDIEKKKMVWSDITDTKGYFSARLEPGRYKILVRAVDFTYPSNIVFGKEDYPLKNVYHGQEFEVSGMTEINFAIPLDSAEISKFKIWREIILGRIKTFVSILNIFLFVFGLVFAIYLYSKNPYWLTLTVLILYLPSFFLIVRNIFGKKARYGTVKDINGNPVSGLVIGLREVEFDRVVAKRVTDARGRYRILSNKGRYYIEVLDTGYKVENIKGDSEILIEKNDSWVSSDITVSKITRV
jgi:hypothetical protein